MNVKREKEHEGQRKLSDDDADLIPMKSKGEGRRIE